MGTESISRQVRMSVVCYTTSLIMLSLHGTTLGQTITAVTDIYSTLKTFYANNKTSLVDVMPLEDHSIPIDVQLTMYLYSVDGFDAVTGQVDISGSLYMEWADETREASIGHFNFSSASEGLSITMSPGVIWTPSIFLLNAVDGVQSVGSGSKAYKLRYQVKDGRVKWQPRTLIKASCTPDVRYYPFDRQSCNFVYTAWGHTVDELQFNSAQSDWNLCDFVQKGLWTLRETTSAYYVEDNEPFMRFSLVIERKPMYFVLNVVFPLLILGGLNSFVFLLPADSGERVGFCVTCFLAFVFLLQTILSFLPQAADPMSIFCVYSVLLMLLSATASIVTILTLRIYDKPPDECVPERLQKFIRVITCVWCKRSGPCRRNEEEKDEEVPEVPEIDKSEMPTENVRRKNVATVTGKTTVKTTIATAAVTVDTQQDVVSRCPRPAIPRNVSKISVASVEVTDAELDMRASLNTQSSDGEKDTKDAKHSVAVLAIGAQDDEQSSEASDSSLNEPRYKGARRMTIISEIKLDIQSATSDIVEEMYWADVARVLDMFFFLCFIGTHIVLAAVFLVPLMTS